MTGSIKYGGYDWAYRTAPCEDVTDIYIEVQHPGNMRWELAGYLLTDATEKEVEAEVERFADNELGDEEDQEQNGPDHR